MPSDAAQPSVAASSNTARLLAPAVPGSNAVRRPPAPPPAPLSVDVSAPAEAPPPEPPIPPVETPVLLPTAAAPLAPMRRVEVDVPRSRSPASPTRIVSIDESRTSTVRTSASTVSAINGSGGNVHPVAATNNAVSSTAKVPNGSAREGRALTSTGAKNRDDSSSSSSSSYKRTSTAKTAAVVGPRPVANAVSTSLAQSATPSLTSTSEPPRPLAPPSAIGSSERKTTASEESRKVAVEQPRAATKEPETLAQALPTTPDPPKVAEAPKATASSSPSPAEKLAGVASATTTETSSLPESSQSPPLPAPARQDSTGALIGTAAPTAAVGSTNVVSGNDPQAGAIVAAASAAAPSWGFGGVGPTTGSFVTTSSPDDAIVSVALKFQGRRKLLRHSGTTRVGQLLELHPQLLRSGKPQVIVDSHGFEVGNEISLATLCKPGSLLELEAKADEW